MTRLLLARHGETDQNRNDVVQGKLDVDLNDTGIEQAQQLAARIEDEDVAAVYASPLKRARRTAEIVAGPHGLEPESLNELEERSYGELEGEDRETYYEALIEHGNPLTWAPDGGEDMQQVANRATTAVNQIRREHPDETVVAVAHGTLIKSFLAAALGVQPGHGHKIDLDNACLNHLTYHDYYGWRITGVNDVNHLSE